MSKFSRNFNTLDNRFQKKEGTKFIPARVKDVILDETHPEYELFGGPNSVGAVKYEILAKDYTYEDTKELAIAFPINSAVREFPLLNEIVLLTTAPDNTINNIKGSNKVTYYTTVVGLWNHPNHNGSPSQNEDSLNLGEDIEELEIVNPLQPYPGDLILEGRQGQSLRFSGYKSDKNTLTDDDNNGDPFIIISNGQEEIGNGYDHITENINLDDSSIYMTSNHSVPLEQIRTKYLGLNEDPTRADQYRGAQVIINSGRLFFNAYEDDINFSSENKFSVTSNELGLDAEEYIGLDAKKIYLGSEARRFESQPAILGDELEVTLKEVADILIRMGTAFNSAVTTNGGSVTSLIQIGKTVIEVGNTLNNTLNVGGQSRLKSKKTFIE